MLTPLAIDPRPCAVLARFGQGRDGAVRVSPHRHDSSAAKRLVQNGFRVAGRQAIIVLDARSYHHCCDFDGSRGRSHCPVGDLLHHSAANSCKPRFGAGQAWIDKLRDELAELFELLTWQFLQRPGTYSGEEGHRYEAEKRSRIRLLRNKIGLRLNPNETDSQALLELLSKLENAAYEAVVQTTPILMT